MLGSCRALGAACDHMAKLLLFEEFLANKTVTVCTICTPAGVVVAWVSSGAAHGV